MQRRPCWVEISTRAFEDNYRLLAAASAGVELLAIVKADAYGHGLVMCAPAAVRAGAGWLGVTSVEEGVAARGLCPLIETRTQETRTGKTGIGKTGTGKTGPERTVNKRIGPEILVIGGVFPGQARAVIEHRLTVVVWEHWQLDLLEAAVRELGGGAGPVAVHLELDTGMSRQGVSATGSLADLDAMLGRFSADGPLRLGGVMMHLYAADESDGAATREQFARLEAALGRVQAAGLRPEWLHVGNSAAVLGREALVALREICLERGLQPMARPGLALYGLAPEYAPEEPAGVAELRAQLQPVLEWKTRVVSVRTVAAGQVVGYNGTFVATEPMRLALLAVGYADGLKRGLSGSPERHGGAVLVRGERAPMVGRISMDQTVVDVTEIPGVEAGDEVVLVGRQGAEAISAEEQAGWAGTIPWEIFTSIAGRVERVGV